MARRFLKINYSCPKLWYLGQEKEIFFIPVGEKQARFRDSFFISFSPDYFFQHGKIDAYHFINWR